MLIRKHDDVTKFFYQRAFVERKDLFDLEGVDHLAEEVPTFDRRPC